jgi:hypothetical protein
MLPASAATREDLGFNTELLVSAAINLDVENTADWI